MGDRSRAHYCKTVCGSPRDCNGCDYRVPDLDPANLIIADLWKRVCTQWRVGGMGGPVGLDYSAVDIAARWMGIEIVPRIFDGIRALECVTLEEQAEHLKQVESENGKQH